MSRQNSRNDRIKEMSQQEILIAKKKQQIIDRQKASVLAKQIIDASSKTKNADKPEKKAEGVSVPFMMKNTFNNDGSFLSQFKKITEQAMKTNDVPQSETGKREGPYRQDGPLNEKKMRLEQPPPPLTYCGTNTTFFDSPQSFLHTITPPKPLELNSIPQPKDLDLNAIPKPVMNMNYKILSEKLPTTVEQLVELVAEVGDVYEEKLCSRIKDLHPSLWFLFDKQSEGYRNYRHLVTIRNQHKDADKYDPAEILVDDKDDEMAAQSQVAARVCYYDDKSTTENDSDTEYMKEAKERNLKNLKKKTLKVVSTTEDRQNESSTDSDYSDDQYDSNHEAYENMSFNRGRSGQKGKRKSRWDHSDNSSAVNKVPLNAASASKNDPAFLQFVYSNFGTLEVSDDKWKNAESHFHIKQLYETMAKNIQDHDRFLTSNVMGKYDSEEERLIDSNKVKSIMIWINELTKLYDAQGNKSMNEFLLPLEMRTFKERFVAKNREPDFEDYKKYKLEQSKFMSTNRNLTASPVVEKVETPPLKRNLVNGETAVDTKKARKSRWGDQVQIKTMLNPNVLILPSGSGKPMLSQVTRTDPALLAYARQNFGTIDLTEEDWKKAEEHFKINLLFQDMLKKRQEIDSLAKGGKFKYEYDSEEDVAGGTWEHKLRAQEMEATEKWTDALNKQSEGKHHIGDFLPPEELKKFMEKYDAKKNNRQPNLSDYKEFKLREDNVGFQMLQKLGWKEGMGLGAGGSGITEPVNKAAQRDKNQGLGVTDIGNPDEEDNEYDAYRKRMMLAYRFRPNPLNNPRRAYY